MPYKSDEQRKAIWAAIRRAKLGVGTNRDIRTARKHAKQVLKSRRKKTSRFMKNIGRPEEDIEIYDKTFKQEGKAAIKMRTIEMKRRMKLLQSYREYRHKRSKINKKYPKQSYNWS